MKPVMFCRNSSGMLALRAELDEVRGLLALSLNRMPLLAMIPTGIARDVGEAVTSVVP
jgi:hypothetical protein